MKTKVYISVVPCDICNYTATKSESALTCQCFNCVVNPRNIRTHIKQKLVKYNDIEGNSIFHHQNQYIAQTDINSLISSLTGLENHIVISSIDIVKAGSILFSL